MKIRRRLRMVVLAAIAASPVACSTNESSSEDAAEGGSTSTGGGTHVTPQGGVSGAAAPGGTAGQGSLAAQAGKVGEGGATVASRDSTGSAGAAGVSDAGGRAGEANAPVGFFVSGEQPLGASFTEWGDAWWKWLVSIPEPTTPVLGGDCGQQQSGGVWYLTGNFGGVETRACTIPEGRAILVPLYNTACWSCPEEEGCSTVPPSGLIACAEALYADQDPDGTQTIEVDGVMLPESAIVSASSSAVQYFADVPESALVSCLGPVAANSCEIPEGDRPFASAGYWAMLKPLSPGEHSLRIHVVDYDFEIDVTYSIAVQ